MPSASSAAPARRRSRDAARPSARARPRALLRQGRLPVRLDRLGRVTLLVVFAVVAVLYVRQGLALWSTRSQAQAQLAIVQRLARENRGLMAQQRALNDPAVIERDARTLGMVRPGEHPYAITGVPTR